MTNKKCYPRWLVLVTCSRDCQGRLTSWCVRYVSARHIKALYSVVVVHRLEQVPFASLALVGYCGDAGSERHKFHSFKCRIHSLARNQNSNPSLFILESPVLLHLVNTWRLVSLSEPLLLALVGEIRQSGTPYDQSNAAGNHGPHAALDAVSVSRKDGPSGSRNLQ